MQYFPSPPFPSLRTFKYLRAGNLFLRPCRTVYTHSFCFTWRCLSRCAISSRRTSLPFPSLRTLNYLGIRHLFLRPCSTFSFLLLYLTVFYHVVLSRHALLPFPSLRTLKYLGACNLFLTLRSILFTLAPALPGCGCHVVFSHHAVLPFPSLPFPSFLSEQLII